LGNSKAEFSVTAFMCVFNEADILPYTLRHLIDQGVDVHVIDNWSTDGSDQIARQFPLAGFERFPAEGGTGIYRWRALLHCVESLANASNATWCVHHDADEIRRSPRPGESLMDAFARMDGEGYSAADHRVFCFQPTDELYVGDPEHYFRYYADDGVDNRLPHIKAWKNLGTVSLARSAGHQAEFPGRRIHPEKLILKHYPIRSSMQGARKVLTERVPRFDPAERAMRWHVQYDGVARTKEWLHDPITLKEWNSANAKAIV
jgi:glycosyltransferase involved in cell wall biosynthesis